VTSPTDAQTFPQLVRATAAAYGDDPAIVLKAETIPDDAATFRELDARSALIAKGLIARGVGKGHRVGFIWGNGPQFAALFAAIARIGAIAIPISTLIKSNELVRVLRQSDVGGLIVQRSLLRNDYVERMCEALPGLRAGASPGLMLPEAPFLRWVVSSGTDLPPGILDMEWLTGAAGAVSDAMLEAVESEVHPTDQLMEIYTSGSMALPKGVKHCHGPAMFRAAYLARMAETPRGKESYAFMPMFWVGGLMMSLLPNWSAGAVTQCTEGTATSNRMAMGSVMAKEDMDRLTMMKPIWGLGMTETMGPYTYGDEIRAEGYPLCAPMDHIAERYEVRLADENDVPVPEGERGEMQVRGYPVTPGLHKVERDVFFSADGYYRTGDMCIRQGSRILFVGRGGDMIKTSSSNVSPAEVEMEMQSLPEVHLAYVVGLPDKERGQIVVAGVIAREGATLDFAAIEAELRRRLSSYKVPRLYVELTHGEVPMLHSNKVSRRQIERLLAERLGREI
jgi:acyl-coenzyme A synthetase/AMP-(fatty) acid ligase